VAINKDANTLANKVRQPAQARLLHETAKFIAYAQSLAETSAGAGSGTIPD
jgi:hypothetical protein